MDTIYDLLAERAWQHALADAQEDLDREKDCGEESPLDISLTVREALHGISSPSFSPQRFYSALNETGAQEFLDGLPYLLEQLTRRERIQGIPIQNDYLLARAVDRAKSTLSS